MKRILVLLLLTIGAVLQAFSQACNTPVINSVSPNTGYVGSTVTISGANFDATPANNQVFFGATQATVLSASFGTLTVTVPVGATYAPVSVKNGCGLIAASTIPFNGIFCGTNITSATYNTVTYSATVSGGYQMLSQDMDLDGKPELLICGFTSNQVSIMRNLSTPGNFNFAAKYDLSFSGATRCIAPADYNGDGKPDLAVVDNGVNGITIFRNNSTPGTLSFTQVTGLPNVGGYQCAAGDLNNDGKIDLVVGSGNDVRVFRNTSSGGTISFVETTTINIGGYVTGLVVADIDGDGVKDVGTANANNNVMIAVRNTTTANATTFTFASIQSYATGNYPYRLFIGDFDKDGKIDFTTNNHSGANVSVFRNTSTPGSVSFAAGVLLSSPTSNYRIGVGDADGDGRPDIVTKSSGENLFSVYRNTSSGPGNISFDNRIDYPGQAEVSGVVIADLDGDYVPDISTSGTGYNTLRIHRNNSTVTDNTPPTAVCKNIIVPLDPTGKATITAAMVDGGSSDACGIQSISIDKTNFTCANLGNNNVILTVKDRAGNTSTCTAVVTVAQAAIIVSGQSTVCQGQTVPLTANLGDSYQWFKDGVAIEGATSRNYTATATGNYTVSVTNAGGCSGTSAATKVTIITNPTIGVTASGTTDLCQGNTVTLTAGAANFYQWNTGAGTAAITVGSAGTYSVTVYDANGCSATSSPITVTVKSGALPNATISTTGSTSLCQGESVTLSVPSSNTYLWSNGATTQSITVNQSGNYTVKVTNTDGCFSTSTPTAVTVKEKPTVDAGQDAITCSTPVQLNAVGASSTTPAPVNTTVCLYDAPGGSGNCNFGTDLCADGYDWINNGTYSNVVNAASATTLTYKVYYTCSQPTFTFKVNGNVIGTFTETGNNCTCSANSVGTYPRTFTFNANQFQQFWNGSGTNTIGLDVSSANSFAFSGATATISAPGATYIWSPASGLSNTSVANPTALPTTTTKYFVTYGIGNGCTATDSVTVKVQCNQPPVARCKALTINTASGCKGVATAEQFNNGSSDPDGDAITFSVSPAGPYALGVTNVILTVTDAKGASNTCATTITVQDTEAPTAAAQNLTVNLDASGNASVTAAQINNGSFDNCGGVTLAVSPSSFNCSTVAGISSASNAASFNGGYIDVANQASINQMDQWTIETWFKSSTTNTQQALIEKYDDGNNYGYLLRITGGNKIMAGVVTNGLGSSGLYITGSTAIVPNKWYHVSATFNRTTGILKLYVNGAQDAISNPTTISSIATIGSLKIGARGNDGNFRMQGLMDEVRIWSKERTLAEIKDTKDKSLSGTEPGLEAYYRFDEASDNTITDVTPLTAANTGSNIGSVSRVGSDAPVGGTTPVTLTVTDANGMINTTKAFITVVDNILPTITAPAAVTVNTDAGACTTVKANVNLGTPVASDNCSFIVSNNAPAIFTKGNTTVTWTVKDASGNTATATQTVTVQDKEAPVPNQSTLPTVTAECSATVSAPTATDNCAGTVTGTASAPTSYTKQGTYTITWTYNDGNGNTSTQDQTVIIKDQTPPVITCPANITQSATTNQCGAIVNFVIPKATDNCTGGAFNYFNNGEPNNAGGEDYLQLYNSGTWNDLPNGNSNRFIVEFNTPTTNAITNYTRIGDFEGHSYYISNFGQSWTAARSSALSIGGDLASINTQGETNFLAPYGGNTWVGGYQDHSDPSYIEPGNASQNFGGWKWVDGTKLGAGQIVIKQIAGIAPGAFYPVGETTNTFTATDEAGNTSSCSFTVTVSDVQKPVITTNGNKTVNVDAGVCGATVSVSATATDNCSVGTPTGVRSDGRPLNALYPIGTTTITWNVTDLNNNAAVAVTQTVIVADNEKPTITAPATVSINTDPGACSTAKANVNLGTPVTADNCSVTSVTNNAPATFPKGNTTVTWTVKDAAGNIATATQVVTVTDGENPTVIPPAAIFTTTNNGCTATGVALGTPVTGDNCGVASVTNDAPASLRVGSTTVTWTVKDAAGNTSTATQTVTVSDNQKPVISNVPSDFTVEAMENNCLQMVSWVRPVASDNCGIQSFTSSQPNFDAFGFALLPVGVTTITYTATDVNNNVQTASFKVTVLDKQAPTITGCPSTITQSAAQGTCGRTVQWNPPTASDNCSGVTFTTDHLPGEIYPVGTTTVTYTAKDASNNVSTCSFDIVITDDEAPVITSCPVAVSATTNSGCTATGVVLGRPTGTDNCGTVTFANDAPAAFPLGNTTVTWTATDSHNNKTTCTQVVTVTDNVKPVFTLCPPAKSVFTNAGCTATGVALGAPTATDNCGTVTFTNDAPAAFPLGSTTVTWTADDGHGNTATCTQVVTVLDNVKPTITCPGTQTLNLNASCSASLPDYRSLATVSDNCTAAGALSITQSPASGSAVSGVGTTVVTLTVTDASNNSQVCSFNVERKDVTPPTITCVAPITVANDLNKCGAVVNFAAPTVTDNCSASGANTVHVLNSGQVFFDYANNVNEAQNSPGLPLTFNPTDGQKMAVFLQNCGSTHYLYQDFTVPSSGPITLSYDLQYNNHYGSFSTNQFIAVEIRNPNTNAILKTVFKTNPGAAASTPMTSYSFDISEFAGQSVRLELIDATINSFFFDVLLDNVKVTGNPIVNGSFETGDYTGWHVFSSSGSCGTWGIGSGASTTLVQTAGLKSGSLFPIGVTTNTFEATDASGNKSTCSFTVTVNDTQAPVIACPSNINKIATSAAGAVVTYSTPVGTDNCSGATTVLTSGLPSGATFPIGTTTVTHKVTDASGNTAQCSFDVTVVGVPPVIVCPQNITVNNTPGQCGTTVSFAATETTAIPASTIRYSIAPGSFFPVGTTTVTATATNAVGTSSCTFTVTVIDNEKPSITAPSAIAQTADAGKCFATVSLGTPVTGDNCGVASVSNDAPATFPVGSTTVTWTVRDIHGNSNTATQVVTVSDNEKPVVTCAAPVSVNNDKGQCGATITLTTPAASDNCGVASVVSDHAATFYPVGETTVTWTVTDVHGNKSTCSQQVTVTDNEAPSITCAPGQRQTADAGDCGAVVTVVAPATGDNCGVASVTNDYTNTADASGRYPVGTTTIVWTVTDIHGNKSNCTQTITVTDNEKPVVKTNSFTIQLDNAGQASITKEQVNNGSTDNCGIASIAIDKSRFDCSNVDANTVTLTVTDIHGNSNTATATVTVVDNIKPTVRTQDVTIYLDANGQAGITTGQINNGSTDNCTIASYSLDKVSFSCSNVGANTVTLTVRDVNGNWATNTATVTVVDNIKPSVKTQNITVQLNAAGAVSITPAQINAGSYDNCSIASYNLDKTGFNCANVGTNTVTLTVKDVHGNESSATAIVTVEDKVAPVVRTKNVTIYLDAAGQASITPASIDNGSTDACGIASLTLSKESFNCSNVGVTNTVTLTVTDKNGNVSAASATVTVMDNIKPTITCVSNQAKTVDNAACSYLVKGTEFDPSAWDNCTFTVNNSYNNSSSLAGASFPKGTTNVTWTVTDASGNWATCSYTVTVSTTLAVTVANNSVLPQGVNGNTIYTGYTPASVLKLTATPSGGGAEYKYQWSVSNGFAIVNASANQQTVQITSTIAGDYSGTVSLTVTDKYGCTTTTSKSIYVKDVRCGNNNDKVLVCQKTSSTTNPWVQICIAPAAVATHLDKGSTLGSCITNAVTTREGTSKPQVDVVPPSVMVYPNPSRGQASLRLKDFTPGKVAIEVLDATGKVVVRLQETVSYKTEDLSLQLTHLAQGLYTVKVTGATEHLSTRLVIAR